MTQNLTDDDSAEAKIEDWTKFLINRVPIEKLPECMELAVASRGVDRYPLTINEITAAYDKIRAGTVDATKIKCQFCEDDVQGKSEAPCPFHSKPVAASEWSP